MSSRRLVIGVETREQRDGLIRFLGERQITSNAEDEANVAIESADQASPGLATIVAAAEEWRCRTRVGEVTLELGPTKTILRTETWLAEKTDMPVMQIEDAMARNPLSVRADATIQEAAAGMRDAGVGALPVVSDSEDLVGIVTDRDIALRAVAEGFGPETTVDQVMTKELIVVKPSDECEDALSLMRERQVRRLPVVEGERLVGIVAQADIAALVGPGEAADTLRELSEPAATEAARRTREGR